MLDEQTVGIVLDEQTTPAEQVRTVVYTHVPREELLLAWEAVQALLYSTRHSHLMFLANRYALFKQFTPHLLTQISFKHGFTGDDFEAALQLVTHLQGGKRRKLPAQVPTRFIKPVWRKFVLGDEGRPKRQPYELCVFATLRDRLRSGDVFVSPSHRYADLNSYRSGGPADWPGCWTRQRAELCRQLNLPADPTDRINRRIDELEALLEPMHQLLAAGGEVRLEDGELVVARLTAEEVPPAAKALQEEVSRRMPVVDLTAPAARRHLSGSQRLGWLFSPLARPGTCPPPGR